MHWRKAMAACQTSLRFLPIRFISIIFFQYTFLIFSIKKTDIGIFLMTADLKINDRYIKKEHMYRKIQGQTLWCSLLSVTSVYHCDNCWRELTTLSLYNDKGSSYGSAVKIGHMRQYLSRNLLVWSMKDQLEGPRILLFYPVSHPSPKLLQRGNPYLSLF